jgi:hypothetical protein
MADIFVSYARADRPRAERLAHALERAGWSVWWDREIPPGRSFDEVIEEALSLARCVIVLWTDASIRSEWVKTEAAEAAQRRILVPILADGARIPLEFRRIQAAAIDDWRDLESNQGWAQLCDAVAALVDSVRRVQPAGPIEPPSRGRRTWAAAGGVTLALTALAGAGAYLGTRQPAAPAPGPALVTPIAASTAPPVQEAAAAPAPAPAAAAVPLAGLPTPASVTPPASIATPAVEAPLARSQKPFTRTPARPAPEPLAERAPSADALPEAARPIIDAAATATLARTFDREPRLDAAASFDVTLFDGVFRDQAGRLSVSPEGVRFHETGGARTFDVPCGALRRVAIATMIADREQRLLELSADGHSYRVRAADTESRDRLRSAIRGTCER